MFRRRSIGVGLKAAALLGAIAGSGCTDDGTSLHIECNLAPEVEEGGCVWSESSACVFDGRLNVRSATNYLAAFKVTSGLQPRQSASPPRPEPNGIQLREAEVELRLPNGSKVPLGRLPNPYTLVGTGYVEPEGTGFMQVELIPPAYVDELRAQEASDKPNGQIVAAIKIRGRTDGQVDVETSNFLWPIRLLYRSPVAGDGQCLLYEDGICLSLAGVDGFAEACLCPSEDNTTDRSCDLGL